jgi:hypothetical protein
MAKEANSWEEILKRTIAPMVDAGLVAQHELPAGDVEQLLPILSRFSGVTSARGTHRPAEDVYRGWRGQREGERFDAGSLDAVGTDKDLVLNKWFSLANKRNWQEKSEFFNVGTGLPGPSRHERNPFIKPEPTMMGSAMNWFEDQTGGRAVREQYGSQFDTSAPRGEKGVHSVLQSSGLGMKALSTASQTATGMGNWMWDFIGGNP